MKTDNRHRIFQFAFPDSTIPRDLLIQILTQLPSDAEVVSIEPLANQRAARITVWSKRFRVLKVGHSMASDGVSLSIGEKCLDSEHRKQTCPVIARVPHWPDWEESAP